jgi:glycolate oxidase
VPASPAPSTLPATGSPLDPRVAAGLREVVGDRGFLDDPARLLVYESDGLTQYRVSPAAVVLPATPEELSRVLSLLHEAGVVVVPRGAGTGLSGGALASQGGVIVGTARMNRILEVDPVNRRARVEPGVVNARLTEATLPHGLIYAPDPSSQSACTLGGNVAENSGGPHCLKYGVTSRYVHALRVALPDGRVVRLGGEEGVGELDLTGLWTGSEGCFGVVVEIEVGLVPAPAGVRTLLALFPTVAEAGTAVTRIMAGGLLPAALEIVDQETIRAVEASVFAAGFPLDAGAALVVEFDGIEAGLSLDAEEARAACESAGATQVRVASDEAERAALWRGRKKAFGAMGRIAPDLLVQDATVPRSRLPQVLDRIARIGKDHDLVVANVFHAGDGNLHPNLLFDRRDPDQVARVEAASREIMAACIEAGGTITGEHGVGIDKRAYLPLVCPPEVLRTLGEVRRVFDPAGRMNPGKVLPDGWGPPAPPPPEPWSPLPPSGPPAPEAGLTAEGAGRSPAADARSVEADARSVEAVESPGRTRDPSLPPGVLEYEPADLVIRVRGEMTLEALLEATRPHAQWFPADPPGGRGQTVAQVILQGVDGPLAGGYGRMRDHLLGVLLLSRRGERLPLGGRVVKNVAGFDLVRLVAGSRGRLGAVEEVTLRLFPLPRVDRSWLAPCTLEEGVALAGAVRETGLPVAALAWLGGGEAGGGPSTGPINGTPMGRLAVRLVGRDEEVREMEGRLAPILGQDSGAASPGWWDALSEAFPQGRLLRAQAPFRRLAQVARVMAEAGPEALGIHALSGGPGETVLARWPRAEAVSGAHLAALEARVREAGGFLDREGRKEGGGEREGLLQELLAVFGGGAPGSGAGTGLGHAAEGRSP